MSQPDTEIHRIDILLQKLDESRWHLTRQDLTQICGSPINSRRPIQELERASQNPLVPDWPTFRVELQKQIKRRHSGEVRGRGIKRNGHFAAKDVQNAVATFTSDLNAAVESDAATSRGSTEEDRRTPSEHELDLETSTPQDTKVQENVMNRKHRMDDDDEDLDDTLIDYHSQKRKKSETYSASGMEWDIHLNPGEQLITTTIDNILRCIRTDQVLVLDSSCINPSQHKPDAFGRLQKKTKLFLPFCEGEHWVLGMFDLDSNAVKYYDSATSLNYHARNLDSIRSVTNFLNQTYGLHMAEEPIQVKTPQQSNVYDCGIFVIVCAIYAAVDRPLPTTLRTDIWRHALKYFSNTDHPHELDVFHLPDPLTATTEDTIKETATYYAKLYDKISEYTNITRRLAQMHEDARSRIKNDISKLETLKESGKQFEELSLILNTLDRTQLKDLMIKAGTASDQDLKTNRQDLRYIESTSTNLSNLLTFFTTLQSRITSNASTLKPKIESLERSKEEEHTSDMEKLTELRGEVVSLEEKCEQHQVYLHGLRRTRQVLDFC